ncbi:MAG: hypothetical protein ASARMPRED_008561 [Alectoria sarmentosa]|nr:MAG: hypothetical protein ASARMPRED_008561 [Alectoria sarmentosa]
MAPPPKKKTKTADPGPESLSSRLASLNKQNSSLGAPAAIDIDRWIDKTEGLIRPGTFLINITNDDGTTYPKAPVTPVVSRQTDLAKRKRTASEGLGSLRNTKPASSRLPSKLPKSSSGGAAATRSNEAARSTAIVNASLNHLQQRPRYTKDSKPGKDVIFRPKYQPKVTDFDWELFDIYPDKDLDLARAAAALPKNVLLSDFWVHQKYVHNLNGRYDNHKADFTRQHDPRMDRVSYGRSAKVWDKGLGKYRFAVDAKVQLHGNEGREQGLNRKSEVGDGMGQVCDVQEDIVPDGQIVLPPTSKSAPWWTGRTKAQAAKTTGQKGDDAEEEEILITAGPLRIKSAKSGIEASEQAMLGQLQNADRKYTDAAKLLHTFSTVHIYHQDAVQYIVDEMERLTVGGAAVKSEDARKMGDSIIAMYEEQRSKIEEAKTTFMSRYPKSSRLFFHVRKEDGTVGPSTRFTTWADHSFEDGKHLLEEGDVFEEE